MGPAASDAVWFQNRRAKHRRQEKMEGSAIAELRPSPSQIPSWSWMAQPHHNQQQPSHGGEEFFFSSFDQNKAIFDVRQQPLFPYFPANAYSGFTGLTPSLSNGLNPLGLAPCQGGFISSYHEEHPMHETQPKMETFEQ